MDRQAVGISNTAHFALRTPVLSVWPLSFSSPTKWARVQRCAPRCFIVYPNPSSSGVVRNRALHPPFLKGLCGPADDDVGQAFIV
jgi:hypothetical protein